MATPQGTGAELSRRTFIAAGGAAVAAALTAGNVAGARPPRAVPRRVALVGTGVRGTSMWGRQVVADYSDYATFVGLCDTNPGRLAYALEYMGVDCPTYPADAFERMVQETRPERLIVTTVDATHDHYIVRGMELGCDIVTEKPLTTDEARLQRILDAQQRTGREVVVTHNYRYAPHRQRIKELLAGGRIGRVTSVDFNWYLDTSHGADYFRRWHGRRASSGTLFVHKACHHFDLLNWWLDSDPEEVYALAALEYYGRNNSFRHQQCRGCPHATQCAHYWDITRDPRLVRLYVDAQRHDGYVRDGCVWDERIDIFDKMAATIRYANGVQVSYSCTTYSPYEGYRIAFNGTKGRLETWIHERQPWPAENYDELRVTDNFGQSELLRIPHGDGGHAGGDTLLLDRIFKDPTGPDPLGLAADVRDGAMAVLIGFAARRSADERRPVRIGELTSLQPQAVRPRRS